MRTSFLHPALSRVNSTARLITHSNSYKDLLIPSKDLMFTMDISISIKKDTKTHMETLSITRIASKDIKIVRTLENSLTNSANTATPQEIKTFYSK